ncbi:MAG: xanthine dehydrogenase family protein molybdopterin-binding subunit [Acidobacteriota bacterium]
MKKKRSGVLRPEGPDKLRGLARYVDDLPFPGGLHGATLRSTVPRGRIRAIRFDPDFPWDECVTATAADIPGQNCVALIEEDQPLLADGEVRHAMEPIVLVAHAERHRVYEALGHIHVEYEPLEPVLSMEDALEAKVPVRAPDNVIKRISIDKGDVDGALAGADVVVEGEYRVPHQEQAYIENQGMTARFEEDGTLLVEGSLQCPYYVQKALVRAFALPKEKVRVVQATTGGGFGGKEEYPSMVAGHAALLARKAGRPVKIVYDRTEDMVATTKRHPARVRHRTGLTREGKLVAQDIDVLMDGGAYATLSPVVLSRGALHATGPYECPNVRVRACMVATNTPPNGAFRGFGAPQTLFAAELHWERIAGALKKDALRLRRLNLVREGSETATGQILHESVGARDVLEAVVRRGRYSEKKKEYARWNRSRRHPSWRGIGVSVCHHGAGFTGSGEAFLASRVALALTRKGEIRVLTSSTEIGQGTIAAFTGLAARTLGVPEEWVTIERADTGLVPDSGPTVASRTCMIVGGLVERAAQRLRERILGSCGRMPSTRAEMVREARRLCGREPALRVEEQYTQPPEIRWDEEAYRGDAYPVYGYGATVVDLEVDRTTFEVRVRRLTAAVDVGRALSPRLVEGQVMGGVTQALGYALLENADYHEGVMQNPQLTNYLIPTALDTPPLDVMIVQRPYSRGPLGAKGVGELPMDIPAPAVAAAVHDATGLLLTELPILPERILEASSSDPAHRQR